MKILFLARYLPQEGSTTHMYTLARGLIDRGHEVHMMSAGPKNDESAIKIFDEVVNYGMKHYKVGFPLKPSFNLLGKVNQLVKYILATPKALYMMFKINPDIVHVHYPVTSYIAKIYCKLTGRKFITTHHAMGIPRHPLHKKADYVIAISRELEYELKEKFSYNNEQIKLIFNGVSESKFNNGVGIKDKPIYKEQLGLKKENIVIGFIGRFSRLKGIDVLLKAINKLNNNIHLVLVGDNDKSFVEDIIKEFKLENKVTMFNFQNPNKFYSAFDIFVLPSRTEGFGLVAVEAMMMGIPIIRSNVGGAYDQIEHGKDGYIFKNEDDTELSKYIQTLTEDKDLRIRMGKNAKEKALNNFTENIMLDKLLDLYEESRK